MFAGPLTLIVSIAAVRIAAASFEGKAVMLPQGADGVGVIGIGVGIRDTDNDRPEAAIVASPRR